jgi:hypothetical protein
MRHALRIAVVVTVLAIPAAALAAGSPRTYAITCLREQYKPHRIILSCGDAGIGLSHLKWSRWSRNRALATGTYYENTCRPTCSAGHTVSRRVTVTLSAPRTCPRHAHPAFGLARFAFPDGAPPHAYRRFRFACPF